MLEKGGENGCGCAFRSCGLLSGLVFLQKPVGSDSSIGGRRAMLLRDPEKKP